MAQNEIVEVSATSNDRKTNGRLTFDSEGAVKGN